MYLPPNDPNIAAAVTRLLSFVSSREERTLSLVCEAFRGPAQRIFLANVRIRIDEDTDWSRHLVGSDGLRHARNVTLVAYRRGGRKGPVNLLGILRVAINAPQMRTLTLDSVQWSASPTGPTVALLKAVYGPPLLVHSLCLQDLAVDPDVVFELPGLVAVCMQLELTRTTFSTSRVDWTWRDVLTDYACRTIRPLGGQYMPSELFPLHYSVTEPIGRRVQEVRAIITSEHPRRDDGFRTLVDHLSRSICQSITKLVIQCEPMQFETTLSGVLGVLPAVSGCSTLQEFACTINITFTIPLSATNRPHCRIDTDLIEDIIIALPLSTRVAQIAVVVNGWFLAPPKDIFADFDWDTIGAQLERSRRAGMVLFSFAAWTTFPMEQAWIDSMREARTNGFDVEYDRWCDTVEIPAPPFRKDQFCNQLSYRSRGGFAW